MYSQQNHCFVLANIFLEQTDKIHTVPSSAALIPVFLFHSEPHMSLLPRAVWLGANSLFSTLKTVFHIHASFFSHIQMAFLHHNQSRDCREGRSKHTVSHKMKNDCESNQVLMKVNMHAYVKACAYSIHVVSVCVCGCECMLIRLYADAYTHDWPVLHTMNCKLYKKHLP